MNKLARARLPDSINKAYDLPELLRAESRIPKGWQRGEGRSDWTLAKHWGFCWEVAAG